MDIGVVEGSGGGTESGWGERGVGRRGEQGEGGGELV